MWGLPISPWLPKISPLMEGMPEQVQQIEVTTQVATITMSRQVPPEKDPTFMSDSTVVSYSWLILFLNCILVLYNRRLFATARAEAPSNDHAQEEQFGGAVAIADHHIDHPQTTEHHKHCEL